MDKYTVFNTINSIMKDKYNYTLLFSDEVKTLICKYDCEKMHKIISILYANRKSDEEYVKKNIASVEKESNRTMGFCI